MQIIFFSTQLLIQDKKQEKAVQRFVKSYPGVIDNYTAIPIKSKDKITLK